MANDLDVGRLRLLREVALRGTIAGAARSLGLTPSAVSQQISALEREAGTTLLDRSPRGVVLTGAGHALASRAEQIADLLASARADLDRLVGSVSGPVAIAAVASAAATVVSDAVAALRAEQPGIAVSVIAAEPLRALERLLRGDADLAIVDEYDYVPLALPEFLSATSLRSEPLVSVTGPEFLIHRRRIALPELAHAEWVMPPEDAACGLAVRLACRDSGFEPQVRWETDDMLLLVRAVAAGHGVAVLPALAVAADAADVLIRPLREPLLHRRLSVVTRTNAADRLVVAAVLSALLTAAG